MKKILVIDDERDVLEVVRSVLKTKGYTVRCAEGGEEGLRQADTEEPDLIICDLMMPRVSGLEVLKRLRQKPKFENTPIIVLSAVGEDSDKPEEYWARGLGVDEYICKPFDPLDLLGRVEFIFRRGSYRSVRAEGGAQARNTPAPLPARATPRPVDVTTLSPVELVHTYVEAWNTRNWETEYACMDQAIVGHFPLDEYRFRRDQAFAEPGSHRTQQIVRVLDDYTVGDMGRVTIEREDSGEGRTVVRKLTFSLKQTPKGWKIVRYKEEPAKPRS